MNRTPSHLSMFDHLGEDGFADFLNSLLTEIFGPSLIPFGKGRDKGRDATFEGIPRKYERIDGYWIFQYKFHEIARVTNSQARAYAKRDLVSEIEKVLKLPKKPDCYIFITNAELFSGDFPDWYQKEVEERFGDKFKHIGIWDFPRLRTWLNAPDLSKIRENFLPQTLPNLEAVSETLMQQLATQYPYPALKQIHEGIYSHNFDWFLETFKKFLPVTHEFVRSELSDIMLDWLKKYPGRSGDVLACLEGLFPSIDLGPRYQTHFSEKDVPLNSTAQIVLYLAERFAEILDYKSLKRVRNFIFSRFNLVSDSSQYFFVSPHEVYVALRKTIVALPDLLRDVIPELSKQFKQTFGEIYKGYELVGGWLHQSGNSFSVYDLAIVKTVIEPVLKESYQSEPIEIWNDLKDILDRRISINNPTWLIRSTIPIVLFRLNNQDTKEEAKIYLKKLINIKRGIPSASDVIFSYLCGSVESLEHDILLELIETDIARLGIPSNIFVVILLFELMKRKNNRAKAIFLKLLENEKYLAYAESYYNTLNHFPIIADDAELQGEILTKLLLSKSWLEKVDRHVISFELLRAIRTYFLSKAKETHGNLSFLNEFLLDVNDLRISLIFKALPDLAKEYPNQVFDFVKENLKDKKSEEYIKEDYARQQVVEVAQILAEKRLGREALWIIDKFFSDPDPRIEEEGEFNYHRKIEKGEDDLGITSVRGCIPWVLQKLSLHREYILDAFKRTQELLKDNNLYVVYEAIIPLIEIVRRRQWLKELDPNNGTVLHALLFELLHKYSKYPAIAKYLLHVFAYYRELNEAEAELVLDALQTLDESAGLFIYYAIYRKDHFKEKGTFCSAPFEKLLVGKILTGPEDLRGALAWEFWKILDEKPDEFDKVKEYISIFMNSPFHGHAHSHLLRLIEEHVRAHFTVCSEWFTGLLDTVLGHIEKCEAGNLNLWHDYSKIVGMIAQKGTTEQYLKVMEKIVQLAKKGVFIDLKKTFQTYRLIKEPEQKQVIKRLENLWIELTRQNPRLVTIDWKEE